MEDANRKSGGSVAGKVMPSSTVPPMPNTGRPGEMPQNNPGRNPSQMGMAKPTVPPSHEGMDPDAGPQKLPVFPR
jgi:hypothetical protein